MGIVAKAPVRICDIGGWTDTWFAGPGRVVNLAVSPGAQVTVRPGTGPAPVVLELPNLAQRYPVAPGVPRAARHPLVEAAIDAFLPPAGQPVEIRVTSAVPPGCGTGTSAAVAVALVGALGRLAGQRLSPLEVARAAHRLEVGPLGAESGIQDQVCSALGGANFIRVETYPEPVVERLPPWGELDPRLTLVYLGRAHDSSDLHRRVIEGLGARSTECFEAMRGAARTARAALLDRDLGTLGRAMVTATEAQRNLLRALVGERAERLIGLARREGALGWKVNGAGGPGGSVTVLHGTPEGARAFAHRVGAATEGFEVLEVHLDPAGLVVEGTV